MGNESEGLSSRSPPTDESRLRAIVSQLTGDPTPQTEGSWWQCGNCDEFLVRDGELPKWFEGSGHPVGTLWDGCAACAPLRRLIAAELARAERPAGPQKPDPPVET